MPGRTLAQGPQANEDYTGHELDPETGMHYAGARFYMSALGRWGTTDPILDENGSGALLQQDPRLLTMSAYNYTFNDPANLLDPDGRKPMMCPPCNPASQALQQGEALFNATFVEPVRQAHDAVASGISTAWENAPEAETVKQGADEVSTSSHAFGVGVLGGTLLTGSNPAGLSLAQGSLTVSQTADGVALAVSFYQVAQGEGDPTEVFFRLFSAGSGAVTGSMAKKAAETFEASEGVEAFVEEISSKIQSQLLEQQRDRQEQQQQNND